MTRPTEAQFAEMEQRARWLLDGVEIQRTELDRLPRPTLPRSRKRVDTQEAIARDVLALVRLIRQS